jgi:hypothetical protein
MQPLPCFSSRLPHYAYTPYVNPIFKLTIATIWNNLIALYVCITHVASSSIDFGVLVCVIRFLDLFMDDPISYTILLPNSNSTGNPFANFNLITDTYSFDGLNTSKEGYVSTFFVYNLIACKPSYVYCCYYYKCCCKCWKCFGFIVVSIQIFIYIPIKVQVFLTL